MDWDRIRIYLEVDRTGSESRWPTKDRLGPVENATVCAGKLNRPRAGIETRLVERANDDASCQAQARPCYRSGAGF